MKNWFLAWCRKAKAALLHWRQADTRACPCEDLKAAKLREEQMRGCYDTRSKDYYALRDCLYSLPGAPDNIIRTLSPIMSRTLSQLRDGCALDVRVSEDGDWEVVTGYCSLGGCDMGIVHLPTERDALIFAAVLKAVGYKIDGHTACSECYAEYMRTMV